MDCYQIDSKKLIAASRNREEEDYDADIDLAVEELIQYKPEQDMVFRHQHHWKQKYSKDDSYKKSINKVSDKILWNDTYDRDDLKQLRKSIEHKGVSDAVLIKNLSEKGLYDCQRVVDLLELFNLGDKSYTDLSKSPILDKSNFQLPKKPYTKHQSSMLLKVIRDLHGDKQWLLNKHNANTRWIQKYYNTGKEFLDTEYSDLATDDTFNTKLEEWKEDKYILKQKYSQKKKDSFKKSILNDTWSCKGIKCLRPELYVIGDFIKLFNLAVKKIGYEITSIKNQQKKAVSEWVISDMFSGISKLKKYEGEKLTKLEKELNSEILSTNNRHLDMGTEKD